MKRKTMYLMLTLLVLSAASVSAQVRIGGNTDPNPSAVLDLNAANDTDNGTLGLALPRVSLKSTGDRTTIANPANGLTIYNTAATGDVTPGVYYYDDTKWVRILIIEADGIVGNEVTAAATGLEITGSGTTVSPLTVGIKTGGVGAAQLATDAVTAAKIADSAVTSAKIADGTIAAIDLADNSVDAAKIQDGAVTAAKLNGMGAESGQFLRYNGTTWVPVTLGALAYGEVADCSGAVVFWGAYKGPGEGTYTTGLGANTVENWTDAIFSFQGRHLCWAVADALVTSWTDGKTRCANLTRDNAEWRLPNLKELHALYVAMGGKNDGTNALPNMDARGYGLSNGYKVPGEVFWSSTQYSASLTYAMRLRPTLDTAGVNHTAQAEVVCVRRL